MLENGPQPLCLLLLSYSLSKILIYPLLLSYPRKTPKLERNQTNSTHYLLHHSKFHLLSQFRTFFFLFLSVFKQVQPQNHPSRRLFVTSEYHHITSGFNRLYKQCTSSQLRNFTHLYLLYLKLNFSRNFTFHSLHKRQPPVQQAFSTSPRYISSYISKYITPYLHSKFTVLARER